jgi:DNA invertase Pin-like site-specific DNA recombinase
MGNPDIAAVSAGALVVPGDLFTVSGTELRLSVTTAVEAHMTGASIGTNGWNEMPRKIGYARVSSQAQNLDRQLGALNAEGCDKIYQEKASGKSTKGRPALEKAISGLGTGDVLVVAEWDRATRSMMDGIAIMTRVAKMGAFVKVLDKPHLDLTTALGRGLLALLSAMAEDERERIIKRAEHGRKLAVVKGVKFGRKRELTDHQQAEARQRIDAGESYRSIGKSYDVSHMTIARLVSASA